MHLRASVMEEIGSDLLFKVILFNTTWRKDWTEASIGAASLVHQCFQQSQPRMLMPG